MALVKNKQIIQDSWHYLRAEQTPLANTIVSLEYWQQNKQALISNKQSFGLKVSGDVPVESFSEALKHASLIAVEFPVFSDGRGYSLAKTLRDKYQFTKEIRAIGDVLPDQAFYLSRVGFDSLELKSELSAKLAIEKLADFSVYYQKDSVSQ